MGILLMYFSTFLSVLGTAAWFATGSAAVGATLDAAPVKAITTAAAHELPAPFFIPASTTATEMQLVATVTREAPSCPASSLTVEAPNIAIAESTNDSLPGPIIAAMLVSGVFLLVPQKRRFL